jgi:predicted HicB family RNase H-like nuclease
MAYQTEAQIKAQKRASLEWDHKHADKITIKFKRDEEHGITKEAMRAAAAAEGMTLNAWILELIKDNI